MNFVNAGLNTFIQTSRILSVMPPESSPIKRVVQSAKDNGTLLDVTYGRKTRAIVLLDTGHVMLSPMNPDTLIGRLNTTPTSSDEIELDV